MTSFEPVLVHLARLMTDLRVPFVLIGGHAVNAWLEPRLTVDIDITAQADATRMSAIKAALHDEGYTVARELGAALPSGPDFIRFVSKDGTTVLELQGAKTDFQLAVIQRAVRMDGTVPVATAEDLLVLKLIANRPKDQGDIAGLLALGALDWLYVEKAAADWGVLELLHRLRGRPPV